MKLAVVVQRYGLEISGGAELHARYIAEHLSRHAEVRVLTTCARDYISWQNEFPAGDTLVNDITVERFPVVRERSLPDFARHSARVFDDTHSLQDELDWLDSEGPASPALLQRLERSSEFDFILLFSVRYYHAVHGVRLVGPRAVLVPTAEREPSLGLSLMPSVFRGTRAVMFNTDEERSLIEGVCGGIHLNGPVVGVGSEIPSDVSGDRARQRFGLDGPYVVYVGRIDANKGCPELFNYFERYLRRTRRDLTLVLIGSAVVDIPQHPQIRHLGFVDEQEKFDVIAGCEALLMPSYFESLSMVALEAWALGRPVIANGHCDVLAGQCLRSGAGLYYQDADEFAGTLDTLLDDQALARELGRRGAAYYETHYSWPVIERVYMDTLAQLAEEPAPPPVEMLPGWLERHRRNRPAAAAVVNALPKGPVYPDRSRSRS